MSLDTLRPYRRMKQAHPSTHPLVRRLWREINEQQANPNDVAERAGVSASAMYKWRRGYRSPQLMDIEACLNQLGVGIVARTIEE